MPAAAWLLIYGSYMKIEAIPKPASIAELLRQKRPSIVMPEIDVECPSEVHCVAKQLLGVISNTIASDATTIASSVVIIVASNIVIAIIGCSMSSNTTATGPGQTRKHVLKDMQVSIKQRQSDETR